MPQRSNWFQRLVCVIEGLLAPEGAKVTESALLWDREAETKREVDILIETHFGVHDAVFAVECVGGASRPADVTWVDKIATKHSHLPVDRSILVSRTGFSASAERKARKLHMQTLSLSEALNLDWQSNLRRGPETLPIESHVPLETRFMLTCASAEDLERLCELGNSALGATTVYSDSGEALGTLGELAARCLSQPEVRAEYGKNPLPGHDGVWFVPVEIEDAAGSYVLNAENERITFSTVRVVGFATSRVTETPWERRSYGSAEVAYLQFPLGDNTVTIVAAEQAAKGPRLQFFLERPANRDLLFRIEMEID